MRDVALAVEAPCVLLHRVTGTGDAAGAPGRGRQGGAREVGVSRSVTVLARTATDAEFLTKAAFVLGGQAGLALAEKLGAQAVIVDAENRVHVSKGLEGKLSYT